MTKKRALKLLNKGRKLTHISFTPEEYIYMKDGKLRDEKNQHIQGFWTIRTGYTWRVGWSIHKETYNGKSY